MSATTAGTDRREDPSAMDETPHQTAQALVPGLTYLAREAQEAGLDTVHELISGALVGVRQWIEDEGDEQRHPQDCH